LQKHCEKAHCIFCNADTHTSWDRNCPEFLRKSKIFEEKHPENNLIYFPIDENWTLTTRPNRIPMENRFPLCYAVNSLPTTSRKPPVKGKRPIPTKPMAAKNIHVKSNTPSNITSAARKPKVSKEKPNMRKANPKMRMSTMNALTT